MALSWSEYLTFGAIDRPFMDGDTEISMSFNTSMYPKGVNADFYNVDKKDDMEVVKSFEERFENIETRDIARSSLEILNMLTSCAGLALDVKIADIGSGTGLFLNPLSHIVGPEGLVLGIEISDVFINHLSEKKFAEDLSNVEIRRCDARDPNLSDCVGSLDICFICDVYHHFEYPLTFARKLRKALKPHGKLVVIDFIRNNDIHTSHPRDWILKHVRAGQGVFRKEILCCGFKLCEEPILPSLSENYCMIFEPIDDLTRVGAGWGVSRSCGHCKN